MKKQIEVAKQLLKVVDKFGGLFLININQIRYINLRSDNILEFCLTDNTVISTNEYDDNLEQLKPLIITNDEEVANV